MIATIYEIKEAINELQEILSKAKKDKKLNRLSDYGITSDIKYSKDSKGFYRKLKISSYKANNGVLFADIEYFPLISKHSLFKSDLLFDVISSEDKLTMKETSIDEVDHYYQTLLDIFFYNLYLKEWKEDHKGISGTPVCLNEFLDNEFEDEMVMREYITDNKLYEVYLTHKSCLTA